MGASTSTRVCPPAGIAAKWHRVGGMPVRENAAPFGKKPINQWRVQAEQARAQGRVAGEVTVCSPMIEFEGDHPSLSRVWGESSTIVALSYHR